MGLEVLFHRIESWQQKDKDNGCKDIKDREYKDEETDLVLQRTLLSVDF